MHAVFSKALDNYIKWCSYLPLRPVWNKYIFFIFFTNLFNSLFSPYFGFKVLYCFSRSSESLTKEKKLLYVCLYYLMWGEAANVRFLPEGLCYIFHHVSL